ncbi:uncharacterized protein LOC110460281 [Mizuhopecten yessoensis]|uniref:uncharacterized protein LOC110460281 n=1 Tax=Mizuhopecten yessoensis TaxID=6573 RepID=UPI000B45D30C|nr:uncharacterized protein LOC110460281 [Mizuhopecten yessoensis]
MSQRRRFALRPELSTEYKALCSSDNPVTESLFGDDLEKQIKDISDAQRKNAGEYQCGDYNKARYIGKVYNAVICDLNAQPDAGNNIQPDAGNKINDDAINSFVIQAYTRQAQCNRRFIVSFTDGKIPNASSRGQRPSVPSTTACRGLLGLESVVEDLWKTAVAPSTRQAYETGFKTFLRFLLMADLVFLGEARFGVKLRRDDYDRAHKTAKTDEKLLTLSQFDRVSSVRRGKGLYNRVWKHPTQEETNG